MTLCVPATVQHFPRGGGGARARDRQGGGPNDVGAAEQPVQQHDRVRVADVHRADQQHQPGRVPRDGRGAPMEGVCARAFEAFARSRRRFAAKTFGRFALRHRRVLRRDAADVVVHDRAPPTSGSATGRRRRRLGATRSRGGRRGRASRGCRIVGRGVDDARVTRRPQTRIRASQGVPTLAALRGSPTRETARRSRRSTSPRWRAAPRSPPPRSRTARAARRDEALASILRARRAAAARTYVREQNAQLVAGGGGAPRRRRRRDRRDFYRERWRCVS